MVFDKVQLILYGAELKVADTPEVELPIVCAHGTQVKVYGERT